MPRKGENIRKRKDGRWEARYEKCRDQNGRIQYGYLYGRTYEAVKKKKLAVLCQNNLQNSPGKCYVFRNLSEEWMLSMRYAVKLSTYACYETLLDTHILPEFGDMPLKYISSASVYAFSEKLKQQGLSPRTIKNLLILFHSILRYGEKQGYLNLSQLEFRYPKINTSPFQLISHEHLTKLITVLSAEDSEFSIGILLCIYTGIRVGELSGIRWEDIDFDKKLLHIRRTISRIKNLDYSGESDEEPKTVLMIGPPKSVSSIRDIPIPDFLLKKMKRIAAEPDSYLLTGTNRKCMEPRNIQRKFQKLLQQCKIPSINIHSLRHAFATRCTEMGFDSKTLSEILGHSSVKLSKVAQELLIINIIMSMISYMVLIILLFYVPKFRCEKELYVMLSFNIILTSIGMEWLYKALEQYTYITVRSVIFKFIALIFMFFLVHKQTDYVIYGGITIFAASASNILNLINAHKFINLKPVGNYNFRRHLKPVLIFFAMSCATTIYTSHTSGTGRAGAPEAARYIYPRAWW